MVDGEGLFAARIAVRLSLFIVVIDGNQTGSDKAFFLYRHSSLVDLVGLQSAL